MFRKAFIKNIFGLSIPSFMVGESFNSNKNKYSQTQNPSGSEIIVENMEQLRKTKPVSGTDTIVKLLGYYTPGDGGGGEFYWDSNSNESDNGGTIIQPNNFSKGRWLRQVNWAIADRWFGVKYDDKTDNTLSFQRLINFIEKNGGMIICGTGIARFKNLSFFNNDNVYNCSILGQGTGNGGTVWRCTAKTGDAIRIRTGNSLISNLSLVGNSDSSDQVNGIHLATKNSNGPAFNTLSNVVIKNFLGGAGLISKGFWQTFRSIKIYNCNNGFEHEAGGGYTSVDSFIIHGCKNNGANFTGPATHIHFSNGNFERNLEGLVGKNAETAPKIIKFTNVHFESNTERDVRLGVGTESCYFDTCRFDGKDSNKINAIEHEGSNRGSYTLNFKNCIFVKKARYTNNEVIKAGPNVNLVFSDFGVDLFGIDSSNVTLTNESTAITHGSIGKKQILNLNKSKEIDFSNGAWVEILLKENSHLMKPQNFIPGNFYLIQIEQDSVGGHSLKFDSCFNKAPKIKSGAKSKTAALWLAIDKENLMLVTDD